MTRTAFALAAALALTTAPTGAQAPYTQLPLGARARLIAPSETRWTTGTVVAADSAAIVLRVRHAGVHDTVLVSEVQSLELSRGRRRLTRGAAGFLIGAVVGGGVAAGMTYMATSDAPEAGFATLVVGVLGAASGAVLGGTLGALTAPERWKKVSLGPR